MNTAPPISDELAIAIRAYSERKSNGTDEPKPFRKPNDSATPASPWVLVFDTETTTDAGQALRFGTYQLRRADKLVEAGLFYDPDGVTPDELRVLTDYARAHDLMLCDRDAFVDGVFFAKAYRFRATIVGFNLPFDISRLAIAHGTARAPLGDEANAMRDGFTFRLSRQKFNPNIRVKHMSAKAALISFAKPMGQDATRGQRKRGFTGKARRGHFIDLKTLASALFARSFGLGSLSRFLEVKNPKADFDDFEGPITSDMAAYAVRDVQATWECYQELMARFGALELHRSIPEKIYSEAGIGKAYIKEMGIAPWRKMQPDFPPDLTAKIMASYFGGRSEVRIRREVRQVMLCDFLSMYPTVCTLMGLWDFVIAQGMAWCDSSTATRALLATVDLPALQSQTLWRDLTTLVCVRPDGDIFPVRAAYDGEAQSTIGLNYLTSDQGVWFTLADCLASRLLTGNAPEVLEAITFTPGPKQEGLRPVALAGNQSYIVDPRETDCFRRMIEMRQEVKGKAKAARGAEKDRFDTEQQALKICANSTSYGIWVEMNVARTPAPVAVTVYSTARDAFDRTINKREIPGAFFHPLLATLITGAARLMLAIAERQATDRGLDWSFCDTDSMAFAKPDAMASDDFIQAVQGIVDWFTPLNPYEFGGPILKVEDVNFACGGDAPVQLYCFAISSKRYALFNLAADGTPIMRKVSAHGLGHLLPPYRGNEAPSDFPNPDQSVLKDGTDRWHCDLWFQIVSAALAGKPDIVSRDYHPALSFPAISRYGATSPDLLRWFKTYNRHRSYREQVKPFNFLLALSMGFLSGEREAIVGPRRRGRPVRKKPPKPVAPYSRDHSVAAKTAFDRETGKPVAADSLKTYAEALRAYHISPESKFLNGDYSDRGKTRRRHIRAIGVRLIGKEANDWERQAALGLDPDALPDYGVVGQAKQLEPTVREKRMQERQQEIDRLKTMASKFGLRTAARMLRVDASNLRRKISPRSAQ
ncbi:DNA polymerase domain-containing protein [Novosphingobium sediminicola]|uniref:Uncharacterized protein n=1 Tax=Novosphingobium sediminicola TaxID=563162 RepID=A0A7W6G7K8_9SPHN|nr:DNA polymerase domain-containing protein [Novosphingobium sediminicola]MBB3956260.1 hypothetical protein [Novosphingobium sediminicola]